MKALFSILFLVALGATVAPRCSAAGATDILVSVPDQRLTLFRAGKVVARFKVSTSKYGLGDVHGSYRTPLGSFRIARKIGRGAPEGAVFKRRRFTGEVVAPNSPGRDPIVTRILWLDGLERRNENAFGRGIYIHGTPQERLIGRPASYGCIRMRSSDIVELYRMVSTSTRVHIVNARTKRVLRHLADARRDRDGAG